MDIKLIVKITSRAWSLDILALMFNGTPGRQAPLLAASGATRTAFSQSLQHLVKLDLLERNPGHGHPFRPEYRLTSSGTQFAAIADRIKAGVPTQNETTILRRAWVIPILAVSQKPQYFSEIKNRLVPITDRALSQSLQQLQKNHWLDRVIDATTTPPRPLYQAANTGFKISQAISLTK